MIVPGNSNILNLIAANVFIKGIVVEENGIIFHDHVKNAIKVMNRLNDLEGLDPIKCFESALPQIKKDLQNTETVSRTAVACYKFNDDCWYSDFRYAGYFKLKKVVREYYS